MKIKNNIYTNILEFIVCLSAFFICDKYGFSIRKLIGLDKFLYFIFSCIFLASVSYVLGKYEKTKIGFILLIFSSILFGAILYGLV